MRRKIVQTGSSLAVTLPAEVVEAFGLKKGQEVDVAVHPATGAVVIRPGVKVLRGWQGHEALQGDVDVPARAPRRALPPARQVTTYLSLTQIVALQHELLAAFGGLAGIRDRGALEASVARPSMTFGGEDLYADPAAKAAALLHALVLNHPFVDGNKRVGAAAAELMLELNGIELAASDQELERVTLATARGEMSAEALAIWFRQRCRPVES